MSIPLTEIFQGDAASKAKNTPHGMAHWAGTGPLGTTCKDCMFYGTEKKKDRRCSKYRQMMRRGGGVIPATTPSCKYYEKAPTHR